MRILLSLTYYLPHVSGITVYNHRLAKGLVERGHRVTVLTSRFDGELPREEVMDGVRVVRLPVWFWISKGAIMGGFARSFARLLREHDAVIMNIPNTPVEAVFGSLITRLSGKPFLVKHMCDIALPASPFNRVVNWVSQLNSHWAVLLSDRVISMTRDYARHSPVLRGAGREVAIIPPPVDMGPVAEPVVREWKRRRRVSGGPLIGIAARISTEKGVEVMLRALPRVLDEFPNARLLLAGEQRNVIGEGAYRKGLQPVLRRVEGSCQFLGLVPQVELPAFYTACDVTVLPSMNRTESFGIVQVESMLCGTPVVASDLPGVRDPIRRTGMGRIVPGGDVQALAAAVIAVLRDPEQYSRPHASVSATYSTERTVGLYESLLRDTAALRRIAWQHLRAKPWFLALQRSIEHLEYRREGRLERPVMDIGTGDGHFAAVAFRGQIDVGVDSDPRAVKRARALRAGGGPVYRRVVCAAATALPEADASVGTVVSNSTLEHIADLDTALSEIIRVLRPGGFLIATVPTDRWNGSLFTPRLLRRLRLGQLASAYERLFTRIQRHHHLLSPSEWQARLEKAGFEIMECRGYMAPEATAASELLHYEGWHNLLAQWITGRWVALPFRPLFAVQEWHIIRHLRRDPSARTTCVYIKARRALS